jgi:hypothetical protein
MLRVFDIIYFKLRKKDIEKAKKRFKKLTISKFFEILTKDCWKYNVQYSIIIKTVDLLIVNLTGRRNSYIFIFNKTELVIYEDYRRIVKMIDNYYIKKCIYISTGNFENRIFEEYKRIPRKYKRYLKLIDGFHFIKEQLGWKKNINGILNQYKLKLLGYLPD